MTREPEDFPPPLLSDALDAVRADDAATPVPERVRQKVMQHWDAAVPRSRRSAMPLWCGAVAAAIFAAIVWSRPGVTTVAPRLWSDAATSPAEAMAREVLFTDVALDDDRASMQYVQVRVPPSALAEIGLPIADPA
ncbi:MAG TPA: hypothetical protein VEA16_15890, partial [Vicinamibacterales bacterium]|nr:hypothetical protein [Vicinamibacterales bacterium]